MAMFQILTNAVENYDCPRCGQLAKYLCRQPAGRICGPHKERIQLEVEHFRSNFKLKIGDKIYKITDDDF